MVETLKNKATGQANPTDDRKVVEKLTRVLGEDNLIGRRASSGCSRRSSPTARAPGRWGRAGVLGRGSEGDVQGQDVPAWLGDLEEELGRLGGEHDCPRRVGGERAPAAAAEAQAGRVACSDHDPDARLCFDGCSGSPSRRLVGTGRAGDPGRPDCTDGHCPGAPAGAGASRDREERGGAPRLSGAGRRLLRVPVGALHRAFGGLRAGRSAAAQGRVRRDADLGDVAGGGHRLPR